MNYEEIVNDAKFVSKVYEISFQDAIKIVIESYKIDILKEINDNIERIGDSLCDDGHIFNALDNISDAIVNK